MNHHKDTHADTHAHACPLWILTVVFLALLVLTVVTVLTAQFVDLGSLNFALAMAIALVKGTLVALFFMHLWWDSKFNSIAIVAGLAFLALFIAFTALDTHAYQNTLDPQNTVLTPDKLQFSHAHGDDAEHTEAPHDKPAEAAH